MQKTLIVSNGYYTTINAIAILKQLNIFNETKILLAYFKALNDVLIDKNIQFSDQAWHFDKIIDYKKCHMDNKFSFETFNHYLNNFHFDNILIPINSSTKKWFSGFFNYYPKANYIFYEEGLLSYIRPILDRQLTQIIKKYTCYYNNFNHELQNFVISNLKVNEGIVNTIDNLHYLSTIQDLKQLTHFSLSELQSTNTKNVLFLPQYYYSNDPQHTLHKFKRYADIIRTLLKNNYRVLIKDHPKENKWSFDQFLEQYLGKSDHIVVLKNIKQFPIELYLNELNLDFVFSVYSTTLITSSSPIFNIPVFTSHKMLKERINSFSLYPSVTCNIVKRIIPDIEGFLSYYHNNALRYYKGYVKHHNLKHLNSYKLLMNFILKTNFFI